MADIDPPWRLDPLQTIVDVQWRRIAAAMSWQWIASWGNSGSFDCPTGPAATTISTTSFTLSPITPVPPAGFTVSGAPVVSPLSVSFGSGRYGSIEFAPNQTATGKAPGSAPFSLLGRVCTTSLPLPSDELGPVFVTIPAITLTRISDSKIFRISQWDASAFAGVTVGITFKPDP